MGPLHLKCSWVSAKRDLTKRIEGEAKECVLHVQVFCFVSSDGFQLMDDMPRILEKHLHHDVGHHSLGK